MYANDKEYFADVTKAYQVVLDILSKPDYGTCNSMARIWLMLEGWKNDEKNRVIANELLGLYIGPYNDCISKIPSNMHVGIHLCRGNFVNPRHFSEGDYHRIATKLFTTLNTPVYYLEYDTPRAGCFESLAHLPKHKNVILAVVTSKFPELEGKEKTKGRIYQAANIMAKGQGESRE